MKKIINSIYSSTLVKNTLKLSASNVALMFLPLIVTPILSRLYTPEEYGVWGVFSGVLFILNSFIFLSYENTIVKSNNDDEIPSLLILCLGVSIMISLLSSVLFWTGKILSISFFLKYPNVLYLFFSLTSSACFTLLICLSNRYKKYGAMSIANTTNGFLQAVIRILWGIFPLIGLGLIIGNILAHILASLLLFILIVPILKKIPWNLVSINKIKKGAFTYKKFPLYDAPARLLEFTVGNIVIIILSFYYGEKEIGCFSMVMQFILLPITVIGSAMGNVFYRELSEQSKNQDNIKIITKKANKISFYLSILPLLFLVLGGDKILVLFLGDKWTSAGVMSLCLAIYSVPVIISEPLLPIFRALDRQEVRFSFNIINLAISIGALIISSRLFDNIYLSLCIYSICYAIVRFFIYGKILNIVQLTFRDVASKGVILLVICYVILFSRIFFELNQK